MALNYRFDYTDVAALTPMQQQILHDHIPFILMNVGINTITEQTIPLIIERLAIIKPGWEDEIRRLIQVPLATFLTKCIGMQCNICNEGTQAWLTRLPLTSLSARELARRCRLPATLQKKGIACPPTT